MVFSVIYSRSNKHTVEIRGLDLEGTRALLTLATVRLGWDPQIHFSETPAVDVAVDIDRYRPTTNRARVIDTAFFRRKREEDAGSIDNKLAYVIVRTAEPALDTVRMPGSSDTDDCPIRIEAKVMAECIAPIDFGTHSLPQRASLEHDLIRPGHATQGSALTISRNNGGKRHKDDYE